MLIENQVVNDAIMSIATVNTQLNDNMHLSMQLVDTNDLENLLGYIFMLENELKKIVDPNQPLT